MARTSIREHIETVVVVTVITVLVWLYAENKNVQRYVDEPVRVKFIAQNGDQTQVTPQHATVKITFRGSSGQKQELDQLKQTGPLQLPVGDPTKGPTYTQQVQLTKALNNSKLADLGIQVTETKPATLGVSLRRMQTLNLPIRVQTGETAVQGEVEVEPEKVTAQMPAAISQTAKGTSVIASLETLDLSNIEENVAQTRKVPLTLPGALQGQDIRIEPDQAKVTFTIKKQTATITLTSVPIHLNAPPLLLQRYDIQLPEDQLVLHNVKLTGSSDTIQRIKAKQLRVWAELRPSADQLTPGQTSLKIHLQTPPGVTADQPPPPITVKVTRRQG